MKLRSGVFGLRRQSGLFGVALAKPAAVTPLFHSPTNPQIHQSSPASILSRFRRIRAFTLLEVLIAAGVLFMCLFAILGLVAMSLRNARALQQRSVDASMLAAEYSITNKVYEGSDSGDFGDDYPDYDWVREVYQTSTNGLYEVDFAVFRRSGGHPLESKLSILMYSPQSANGRP